MKSSASSSSQPSIDGDPEKPTGDPRIQPQKRLFSWILASRKVAHIPTPEERVRYPWKHTKNPLKELLFLWCLPVLRVGYQRVLEPEDLYKIEPGTCFDVEQNTRDFVRHFTRRKEAFEAKYLKKKGLQDTPENRWKIANEDPEFEYPPYLVLLSLFDTYRWTYLASMACKLATDVAMGLNPMLMRALIAYVHRKATGLPVDKTGYGYAVGVAALVMTTGIGMAQFFHSSAFVGAQVKGLLTKVLLDKSFKLDRKARNEFPPAVITSLLGTDLSRIDFAVNFFPFTVMFPTTLTIAIVLLAHYLGGPVIAGVGFFLLATVVIVYATRPLMRLRRQVNVYTDGRIRLVKELLNSMKIIKYYSWEPPYAGLVSKMRSNEMGIMLKIQFVRNSVTALATSLPSLSSMVGFLSIYGYRGTLAGAANIFSSLALFNILQTNISLLPIALSSSADAYIACKRVQSYLLASEEQPDKEYLLTEGREMAMEVKGGEFQWEGATVAGEDVASASGEVASKITSSSATTPHVFTGLHSLFFRIPHGEFVVVTGPIGSGKSSLLSALSGSMPRSAGTVTISGRLLLCSAPWIQNATVRENITFGSPPDENLYREVVSCCGLISDFEMLPAGDMTEIGERGVNLSGGQKARITLARAVYRVCSDSNYNIILLDDILSAVDAKVGKHIMDECIMGLLKRKTRILATHQLSLIRTANRIMFLNPDGTVDVGSPEELLERNKEFGRLMEFQSETNEEEEEIDEEVEDQGLVEYTSPKNEGYRTTSYKTVSSDGSRKDRGVLMQKEVRQTSAISSKVLREYLQAGCAKLGIPLTVSMILTSMIVTSFCFLFQNVWLSFWQERKFKDRSDGFYIGIYVMFSVLFVASTTWQFCSIVYVANNASEKLNIRALDRILRAPMAFFDTTPMGRILNRFTKDTDVLDNEIAEQARLFSYGVANMIGIYIMIIIYIPYFAIFVPFILLTMLMLFSYYQATAREVKRIEGVQRSVVYSNFDEVLQGNETIKIYSAVDAFVDKNTRLINTMNEAYFLTNSLQRWLAVTLHLVTAVISLVVSLMSVGRVFKIGAAASGLVVSYSVSMSFSLISTTRSMGQLEQNLNSVERICEYALDMPQEAAYETTDESKKPRESWPEHGAISFRDVSLRYRPGLPRVLSDVTLDIRPREKIGICGRTGAGKSTIMTAFYRLSEPEGTILIDGVDISQIGLHDLRSKLSIIPQDPVLFQGTIRTNLDPFNQLDDERLYDSLRRSGCIPEAEFAEVKSQVKGKDDLHKFHLDTVVEDNGANFSLGQRQMLAITRAIVKDSKILILDEATSSVDYETDAKVQATIVREFGDCTILCIAHRLKTIVNYDRLLVMDKGRVAEFDTPKRLWGGGGIFRAMCDKGGVAEEDFANDERSEE